MYRHKVLLSDSQRGADSWEAARNTQQQSQQPPSFDLHAAETRELRLREGLGKGHREKLCCEGGRKEGRKVQRTAGFGCEEGRKEGSCKGQQALAAPVMKCPGIKLLEAVWV